jgi:hypothetical protein
MKTGLNTGGILFLNLVRLLMSILSSFVQLKIEFMRSVFIGFISLFFVTNILAQKTDSKVSTPDPAKKIQVVETACGECQFKLTGKGCDLAVRMDGKAHFVDGTDIDSHGDAHAKDGFCNAVRKAEVQGELVNNRFKVTYFKLIKEEAKKDSNTKQQN